MFGLEGGARETVRPGKTKTQAVYIGSVFPRGTLGQDMLGRAGRKWDSGRGGGCPIVYRWANRGQERKEHEGWVLRGIRQHWGSSVLFHSHCVTADDFPLGSSGSFLMSVPGGGCANQAR